MPPDTQRRVVLRPVVAARSVSALESVLLPRKSEPSSSTSHLPCQTACSSPVRLCVIHRLLSARDTRSVAGAWWPPEETRPIVPGSRLSVVEAQVPGHQEALRGRVDGAAGLRAHLGHGLRVVRTLQVLVRPDLRRLHPAAAAARQWRASTTLRHSRAPSPLGTALHAASGPWGADTVRGAARLLARRLLDLGGQAHPHDDGSDAACTRATSSGGSAPDGRGRHPKRASALRQLAALACVDWPSADCTAGGRASRAATQPARLVCRRPPTEASSRTSSRQAG